MAYTVRRVDDLGAVTFETCHGGDELRDVLDECLAVEASGWKGRGGTAIACDPTTLVFYRRVARWAGEHGWLLLTMLRVDRRIVAFSFGFDHHGVFSGLRIGYDERYARLSPGSPAAAPHVRSRPGGSDPRGRLRRHRARRG